MRITLEHHINLISLNTRDKESPLEPSSVFFFICYLWVQLIKGGVNYGNSTLLISTLCDCRLCLKELGDNFVYLVLDIPFPTDQLNSQ